MERLLVIGVDPLASESLDGATLRHSLALLDALYVLCPFTELVRLGLYALPVRGPSRFFGGEWAVLDAVRATVRDVVGYEPALGIGEGLFCGELAARANVVLAPGESDQFRRAQSLDVLGRRDLATVGRRLGLHTVGSFADLAPARVAERFNRHACQLHRVARGELSELPSQRDPRLGERLSRLRGESAPRDEQIGFFGQRGAGDERAEAAAHRVRRRLGPDAVVVATLCGGRLPQDRATLVPWGSPLARRVDAAPWPGQLGTPSPATTLAHPVAVRVRGKGDVSVRVDARGSLNTEPTSVLFSSRSPHDVLWYAGPWPTVERWWALARRRAHLQVVLDSGQAVLLCAEAGKWQLVGIYD